ncbi:hypothetical protein FE840_020665 (plasmid) [Peteryoungia desertarenae]|uniref:Antifreeze protein n=1 Tax=Peteryoungia desertarenae TaxID=1813451 RepID=A0ABX6QUP4_9HYPH|nr:hypothetical protein [Peteryoungia desertarenae]QLF72052.1 hypothetical protein FE840_020665 [Peteryoungia desertarenae]
MGFLYVFVFGAALAVSTLTVAQERTASGNLQTEASWSALKILSDNAMAQARVATTAATDARTRADNAMTRANEAHTLAGQALTTANGAQATANHAVNGVNNISYCGRHGMLFTGTSCRAIPSTPVPANCNWTALPHGQHHLVCPSSQIVTGLAFEGATWSNARDNHAGPEIYAALCCSLQ